MPAPKHIDIATAAVRLGVAKTTVWGMVKRGELSVVDYAGEGSRSRMMLDATEVDHAPHGRHRGHPRVDVTKLRGAAYAKLRDAGKSPAEIARKFEISRQAVADALTRFDAAQKPRKKSKV